MGLFTDIQNGIRMFYLIAGKKKIFHNSDFPAIIINNDYFQFFRDGELHRDDGPAVILSKKRYQWLHDGKRHRKGGPAVIHIDEDIVSWWINGTIQKSCTYKEFEQSEDFDDCKKYDTIYDSEKFIKDHSIETKAIGRGCQPQFYNLKKLEPNSKYAIVVPYLMEIELRDLNTFTAENGKTLFDKIINDNIDILDISVSINGCGPISIDDKHFRGRDIQHIIGDPAPGKKTDFPLFELKLIEVEEKHKIPQVMTIGVIEKTTDGAFDYTVKYEDSNFKKKSQKMLIIEYKAEGVEIVYSFVFSLSEYEDILKPDWMPLKQYHEKARKKTGKKSINAPVSESNNLGMRNNAITFTKKFVEKISKDSLQEQTDQV